MPDESQRIQAMLTSNGFSNPAALGRKLCLIIRLLENLVSASVLVLVLVHVLVLCAISMHS